MKDLAKKRCVVNFYDVQRSVGRKYDTFIFFM